MPPQVPAKDQQLFCEPVTVEGITPRLVSILQVGEIRLTPRFHRAVPGPWLLPACPLL